MLVVCWKIAYVRGLQPAFSGPLNALSVHTCAAVEHQQKGSLHTNCAQYAPRQFASPPPLPRRPRTGWLLPLSGLAGAGLAWYSDTGSPRERQVWLGMLHQSWVPCGCVKLTWLNNWCARRMPALPGHQYRREPKLASALHLLFSC